jgi:hypothetical protein
MGNYGAYGYPAAAAGYSYAGYQPQPQAYHPAYAPLNSASSSMANGPMYTQPVHGGQPAVPVFPGQPGRYPNAHPVVDPECPALNLANSTGGAGCEPGYNYYFPAEHTKIHVIRSRDPPWSLQAGQSMHFGAYHVPTGTTLAELLKGFGATNPSAKKNRLTEVIQGGNGKWYKGMSFGGDEKGSLKQIIKEVGWDATRTGRTGEKPVVWLWVTKD